MISKGHQANFGTLLRAAENDDLCIMECTDTKTGKPVIAVCAVGRDKDGNFEMVPLAKLFDGNPYEELMPPSTETVQ